MPAVKRKNNIQKREEEDLDEENQEKETLKKLKNLSITSQKQVEVVEEYKDFLFWKNWILM